VIPLELAVPIADNATKLICGSYRCPIGDAMVHKTDKTQRRYGRPAVMILAFCILGMLQAMLAQGLTGTISGTVRDPAGSVIPAAIIVVKNAATNAAVSAKSDESGYYRILNLQPGIYTVSAEAAGFRKSQLTPQTLNVASALRADFQLELGGISETVTIHEELSKVNTEDAQLGKSLGEIANLPNVSGSAGRNPLNLLTLQAGVISTSGGPSTTVGNWSVNGQRAQANNFLLDGTDSNDLALNVPDAVGQISPNALAEFRVVTGAMKAEYGRNSGAVVEVVTKSGSNQFHGGATEVFRNTALNASNFFQNVSPGGSQDYFANGSKRKPQWNTNDYDAQIGGYIVKDRAFFFVNYLGFKRRQAQVTTGAVFSDAERAAITQYGTTAAKNAMALVPQASGGTFFGALGSKYDRDQGLVKIDHRISAKNTLSGTYFVESQRTLAPLAFGGGPLPGFGSTDLTRFQNVILHDVHTIRPTLLNDARASYHRRGAPGVVPQNTISPAQLGFTGIIPDDAGAAGPPYFDISGLSSFGNTYQGPQSRFDNTYQLADSVSWMTGRHSLRFGWDWKTYQQNQLFDFINNGYLGFDGTGTETDEVSWIPGITNSAVNDFARGWVVDFEQSNSGRQGYRDKFVSLFAQDDWKISRTLSLNFGLRWDYTAPLTELNNQVIAFRPGVVTTQFKQTAIDGLGHAVTAPTGLLYYGDSGVTRSTYERDLNNFAPRLGFAWDVRGDGKTSVRGGGGVFYDAPVSEMTLQFLGNPPLGLQTYVAGATDMTHPYETGPHPIANPFPFKPTQRGGTFDFTSVSPIGVTVMDPNFRTPYGLQWSLQVQHEVAPGWTADAGYVASTGVKLLNRVQLNPASVTATATSANTNGRRLYNQLYAQQAADYGGAVYAGITGQASNANSNYNSMQLSLTKQRSHGLMMNHAYTWSHALDASSSLRVNGVGNIYNRALDYGNGDTDVRHRYVMTADYDLPKVSSNRGFLGKTLGGWNVSGVLSAQAGLPFSVVEPDDRALTGGLGGNRPDAVGGKIAFADPRSNSYGKQNSYFNGTGGATGAAATNPYFHRVGSAASAAKGAGRYGTLGRNTLIGPGLANVDVKIAKTFHVTERHTLNFRAEAFNVFNHTNFINPSSTTGANIGSSSFGRITSARDPRLMQLTLRYDF
jgi:hypothetical protein